MLAKREAFWELLQHHSPDIVVGYETWLNPSVLDSEIIPTSYTLHQTDRHDGYGEVMIGVKHSINSQPIICSKSCKLCSIKLDPPHGSPMIIIGVYRPPSRNTSYTVELCHEITNIVNRNPNSFICCTGDFNVPDINWDNESIESHNYPVSISQAVLQMSADCGFTQLVDFPTRERNILDLFFTNRPLLIDQCLGTSGISDHDIILLSIQYNIPKQAAGNYKCFLWNKADLPNMKRALCEFVNTFVANYSIETPVEQLWCAFRETLQSALEHYVPSKASKSNIKIHGLIATLNG